jgi:hypothetical protein
MHEQLCNDTRPLYKQATSHRASTPQSHTKARLPISSQSFSFSRAGLPPPLPLTEDDQPCYCSWRRRCSVEKRQRARGSRKRKAHAAAWADQSQDSLGCSAFRRIGASESHPQRPRPAQEPFLKAIHSSHILVMNPF